METDSGGGKESFLEDRMANGCCRETIVRNGAAGPEDKERREAASRMVGATREFQCQPQREGGQIKLSQW